MIGVLSAVWRFAKVLPWRYILAALVLAGSAWQAYSWAYDRGHARAAAVLQPQIDTLKAQIDADEKRRQEAKTEAARLAKQWEERRDAIQTETNKLLAAARSDNDHLRQRVLDAAKVPEPGDNPANNPGTAGQCSLPEASRIFLGAHGSDLVRLAADADHASTAAVACNAAYDAIK